MPITFPSSTAEERDAKVLELYRESQAFLTQRGLSFDTALTSQDIRAHMGTVWDNIEAIDWSTYFPAELLNDPCMIDDYILLMAANIISCRKRMRVEDLDG